MADKSHKSVSGSSDPGNSAPGGAQADGYQSGSSLVSDRANVDLGGRFRRLGHSLAPTQTTLQLWTRHAWQTIVSTLSAALRSGATLARRLAQRSIPFAQAALKDARKWFDWLANYGTQGYPDDILRRLKILNLIAYLIGITTLIYTLQHLFIDLAEFWPLVLVNSALISLAFIVPYSHRFSPVAGGLIVVITEWIALALLAYFLGAHAGVQLQYFIGAAAPFVVFGLERLRLVLATVVSGIALHIVCWYWFPPDEALLNATPEMINGIYTQAAITTGAMIAAAVWYAFQLVEDAKAETDRLLRNILPDTIVEFLVHNPGQAVAHEHEKVTVLFADISGFVALSKSLGPQRIVALLNELVRAFDDLAERYGIEKIKTIGDAYMAAAGVPEPVDDPVVRMARFARAMLETANEIRTRHGVDLELRVGLAVGPLTAGVIGTRKFSYDIWGDTVNLAARLESASARGKILVCPDCRADLDGHFELESHGEIEIRGVGRRQVWFVGEAINERAENSRRAGERDLTDLPKNKDLPENKDLSENKDFPDGEDLAENSEKSFVRADLYGRCGPQS